MHLWMRMWRYFRTCSTSCCTLCQIVSLFRLSCFLNFLSELEMYTWMKMSLDLPWIFGHEQSVIVQHSQGYGGFSSWLSFKFSTCLPHSCSTSPSSVHWEYQLERRYLRDKWVQITSHRLTRTPLSTSWSRDTKEAPVSLKKPWDPWTHTHLAAQAGWAAGRRRDGGRCGTKQERKRWFQVILSCQGEFEPKWRSQKGPGSGADWQLR